MNCVQNDRAATAVFLYYRYMKRGTQDAFLFQFQHSKTDWQIKAGPFLSDVGRGKVDGDPLSVRPAQPAIANGRGWCQSNRLRRIFAGWNALLFLKRFSGSWRLSC
jgi:hypothetical protein